MTDFDSRLSAITGNLHAGQPLTQADAWWLLVQVLCLRGDLDFYATKAKQLARDIERSRETLVSPHSGRMNDDV